MKKFIFLLAAVLCGIVFGKELEPYLPGKVPFREKTFLKAEQLIPGGSGKTIDLCGIWKFKGVRFSEKPFSDDPGREIEFIRPEFDDRAWPEIKVPLNWFRDKRFSYGKYFNNINDSKVPFALAWYRRSFDLPGFSSQRVLLNFEMLGYEGQVYINGKAAGHVHGDFVPTTLDITDLVQAGKNTVAIRVRSDFRPKASSGIRIFRTYGALWWWENIKSGLWRPVRIRIVPDVYFETVQIASKFSEKKLEIRGKILNHSGRKLTPDFSGKIHSADASAGKAPVLVREFPKLQLAPGENEFRLELPADKLAPWSPEDPNLYFLTLFLNIGGKTVTAKTERFGFRELRVEKNHFIFNGKYRYMFGENISSDSFGGYDRTDTEEIRRIRDTIKARKAAGVVILRTPHMPPIKEVIDAADELGMMITDEWSYAFTISNMDEPRFERVNIEELSRFIRRDFNAPSVVMWSLGNEVSHGNRPEAFRQLSKQVEFVKKADFQHRPVIPFSGVGGIAQYGSNRFNGADVIDWHTYHGITDKPWTHYWSGFDNGHANIRRVYPEPKPIIIGECIGYSWANHIDRKFRPGNLEDYFRYATKPFTWGCPNGIGYAGANGLAALLDPKRNTRYAMDKQGGRIGEFFRQDARIQGFSPWGMPVDLPQYNRWNQPVYPALRVSAKGLPPRNLFGGDQWKGELYAVNNSSDKLDGATVKITLVREGFAEMTLKTVSLPALEPDGRVTLPVTFSLPAAEKPTASQFRLTIFDKSGKEIARNYANFTLDTPSLRTAPVKTTIRIGVLSCGGEKEVTDFLKACKIPFRTIKPGAPVKDIDTLLVPPGTNPEKIRFCAESIRQRVAEGACIVIMEQAPGALPVFEQFMVSTDVNALADLVLPQHPLFKDMDMDRFDVWSSNAKGNVVFNAVMPFTKNVLAAKPPQLVRNTVGMGILEAKAGKGRLLVSQLRALPIWRTESAAARYLRNLLTYAGNRPLWNNAQPIPEMTPHSYSAEKEDLVFIDLRKHANRSFTDDVDNDRKGGWLDQGKNDFRMMPKGKIMAAGIPFNIIDPATNNGSGCLIVRGSARKWLPAAIEGIPLKGKFSRLFFLHTSGYTTPKPCGVYRFHYIDGSTAELVLNGERNIGDWWRVRQLPDAKAGFVRKNQAGAEVGFYVTEWRNPQPMKELSSMDFISAIKEGNAVDWANPDAAVPVLAAITAEKASASAEIWSGKEPRSRWWSMGWRGGEKPTLKIVRTTGNVPVPWALKVSMNGVVKNAVPVISTSFDLAKCPESPRALTFWIKTNGPGVLDFVFPGKDWSLNYSSTVMLNIPGKWVRIRIPWKDFHCTPPRPFRNGRSEFFIYNGYNQQKAYPRSAISFEITGVMIE